MAWVSWSWLNYWIEESAETIWQIFARNPPTNVSPAPFESRSNSSGIGSTATVNVYAGISPCAPTATVTGYSELVIIITLDLCSFCFEYFVTAWAIWNNSDDSFSKEEFMPNSEFKYNLHAFASSLLQKIKSLYSNMFRISGLLVSYRYSAAKLNPNSLLYVFANVASS